MPGRKRTTRTRSARSEPAIASAPRVTRRAFVAAGSLAWAGTYLAGPTAASPAGLAGLGRAKSVVVLYLYGAPSQMDTLDPKPDAPVETRGEFSTISSSLPGVPVCEHLPRIASALHRMALVRSMTHSSNNHAVSVALSGLSTSEPAIEANGQDPRHQPYFGSVLEYVWQKQGIDATTTGAPIHMILPWSLNARSDPNRWSPHAAWLGRNYNPLMPVFAGQGSRAVGNPSAQGPNAIFSRFDPYDGVTPESTFRFDGTTMPEGVAERRLADRRRLLDELEARRRAALADPGETFAHYRNTAFDMIADPRVARAVDVTREPLSVRERYGLTLFGQEALAARRLIESGVKVVTAFWDDYAFGNNAWDTHFNHFPRLKEGLCPIFDQVLPAFLDDMQDRGLLDETLVMVISEHGRTPQIKRCPGGGREHWAGAYWALFFGAGIKTGQVIGATDRQGGYPTSHPTDPKDILATMYHLLGIDPHTTTIPDRAGRPTHLIPHGEVVRELLA
ncbi:MAG: DUF1501 domain-containing protein [Planctomycetia bacterium]|nr:DUF1501 domain-containing protein [Planctomycetia bacterium]